MIFPTRLQRVRALPLSSPRQSRRRRRRSTRRSSRRPSSWALISLFQENATDFETLQIDPEVPTSAPASAPEPAPAPFAAATISSLPAVQVQPFFVRPLRSDSVYAWKQID